jgi:5-formyltetrahydrofolate cyclo-ligase
MSDTLVRKAEIRARVLAARRSLPAQVRRDAAHQLQATLVVAVREAAVRAAAGGPAPLVITGYVPIGAEPGGPDLPAVLARALGPDGRLLLPVLRDDRDLDWVRYENPVGPEPAGEPLSATAPPGERLGPAAIRQASLLVVPAVAVDRTGLRLGRGGGSYDRALTRATPGAEVVALLYDGELHDDPLPADPHDRRVTAVITPARGRVRLPAGAGAGD